MQEIWRNIEGYEQYYQISSYGRVKSKDRKVTNGLGNWIKKSRYIKPIPNNQGYLRIQVTKDGIRERIFVHRLVAKAFIPNPEGKPHVNHMDSNPLNNNVENLEWVTHKENMHHAINKGRFKASFAKTTQKFKKTIEEKQIPVIGTSIETGKTIKFKSINEAGRHFNGRAGDICKCCKGERNKAQGYKWEYAQ
jgi:hypothetical protein